MKKISFAYWKRHKRRAFSIMLAIMLSVAALVCSAFLARSARVTLTERAFDQSGYYDIMLPKISDDIKDQFLNNNIFAQTGLLYRGGICRTGGSEPFVYGALSDKDSEHLLHLSALNGRYPENNGELAADKTALQAMGVYPKPGEKVILEMYDFDGGHIADKQFDIVGVLDDGDPKYGTGISREEIFDQELSEALFTKGIDLKGFTLPKVYMYPEDLPICSDTTFMGIFDAKADIGAFKTKLSKNGIAYLDGSRLMTMYVLTGKAVLFSLDDVSEASLIADLSDAQKDFNAQVLIPVITMLTLIITFLSTYDVVSTSMEERSRQFGLLRCMGMTQKSVFLRLAAEALAFVLASMLIGFIIGVFIYWLIITIQINVFEMRTFYAFNVHKVIDAITLNPYAYPLIAGFVCAFAAVLMPAFRHIFLSPLEIFSGLRHSKKIKAYRPRQSAMRLLSGRLHSKLVQNLTTVIIVITLMSAGFFGFLYFSAQAESSNSGYQKALKNANLHGLDYLAAKDFNKASCGAAQLNLHGTGMREKELQKLKNSGYADKIRYAIEAKSTKAVYTESEENTKIINAIEGCGLHPWYDFLIDLHNKSLLHQGYAENERLFNIPTVGISKEGLEELKGFLAKGSINYDALAAGEEVLILEVEGKGITNPYNIGDIITMTDAVIDNIDVENYDFSSGMIPEGLEPHFYYVYTNPDASPELGEDGKPVEISGYAFGKRNDYTVKVGGRLVVTDETLAQFYFSEPLQGDCGFNFLCHKDAFEYWGLPDRNYTKVGAALGNAGNIEAFDRIWFSAMGNSRDMISVSTADIRISMRDSVYVNMSTFFAMIVMLVALGLVGIVNTIKLRMRKQAQTFSMLRAIGMRITDIKMLVVRQNLRYPLIGALLCWIPVAVFEAVKRYIYDMLESGVYSGMIAPVNGKIQFPWYKSFPLHIDLLKQPLVPAFLITFAVMTLIMVIASLLPIRWLGKQSIVETIRRDDF